jgi:gamma-glutamylcyclotransferase (GGCT)/AIG2-like uncharacterized protein YtfP
MAGRVLTIKRISDLFVYGTLGDPAHRRRVLGRSGSAIEASLENYARRDGKYPYLVRAEGKQVRGLILRGLGQEDFARLDGYEVVTARWFAGATRRLYLRELVDVVAGDGRSVRCWVYTPNLADWPAGWK